MKRYITLAALALMAAACTDWVTPERIIVQNPDQQSPVLRDDAYYAALREYKKTKHKKAFGWYGSWTATGASEQTRLISAPDSMDIISIWSGWSNLSPEQIADKQTVQQLKGTKVTFTIFLNDLPEEFKENGEITDAAIENFAKAYADSIAKYDYDGIDLDYEPGFGATGPLVGHDNELFRKTIIALGKYLGPKSGTGKLLIIDGVPYAVHADIADYFDYGIVQAYSSPGYTDLQARFDEAAAKGWKPEQYIFAENFESLWQSGGVSHLCRNGEQVNSLLGMARFNPEQGFAAGFGAYHMEYEYGHSDEQYKYMRRAIQDVNPAGGSIVARLNTADSNYGVILGDADTPQTLFDDISLTLSRPAAQATTFKVEYDPTLVEAYNSQNGTSFTALDGALLELGDMNIAAGSHISDEYSVGIQVDGLKKGNYLVPLRIVIPEEGAYTSETELVHYISIKAAPVIVDFEASELSGAKIEPDASWRLKCYNGYNTSGWTGVWYNDTDEQQAAMFDGQYENIYWYTYYTYFSPGNFIAELEKPYEITGLRWHSYYGADYEAFTVLDVQISNDRENWESLSLGIEFQPQFSEDLWISIPLKETVTARYFRVIVTLQTYYYLSMDEAELWGPADE